MILKSFKTFLNEDIELAKIQEIYINFKKEMESKAKLIYPDFNFIDTNHIITQAFKRSGSNSGDKGNIPITVEELQHIFEVVLDRFFRPKDSGGIITQVSSDGVFMVNAEGRWEFQHKIFFDEKKHYRCIVYSVGISVEKKINPKGKAYMRVTSVNDFALITINPSDKDGKDNPKYKYTNGIVESVEHEVLNLIED